MAFKHVMFRAATREKALRGATQRADAVRITLGPRSKSVLIQRSWGAPLVCNDGVTIAKEIQLNDPEENLGVQRLRQAAEQTADVVGDGTSGTMVVRIALERAASVANILLLSDTTMAEIVEPRNEHEREGEAGLL